MTSVQQRSVLVYFVVLGLALSAAFHAVADDAMPSSEKPFAYLIPSELVSVLDRLAADGIELEQLREDISLDVEYADVLAVDYVSVEPNQPRKLQRVDLAYQRMTRRILAGTIVVRTEQKNGTHLIELLEPRTPDGLATWDLFEPTIRERRTTPIHRLAESQPVLTAAWKVPSAAAQAKVPLTFDLVYGPDKLKLSGEPATGFRWIDDEFFLQKKQDRYWRVQATSGTCTPLFDADHLASRLQAELEIELSVAQRFAGGDWIELSPKFDGAVFDLNGNYVFATFDGSCIKRLTGSPSAKELGTFSPDGRKIAFVQDYNLFVADVYSGVVRQLTTDGQQDFRNAKADWVYFEEVYSRSWKAFKWSPDSRQILFQRFDDRGVDHYTVLNDLQPQQAPEIDRYPVAGRPNPKVRLGVVSADGGTIRFADLELYSPDSSLITHFVWQPDSQSALVYVQDRTQTWLDVLRWDTTGTHTTKLFRETTKAWVDNPGDPFFLDDGSFFLPSERDGWRHIYHFAADGSLKQQITSGPWEVRQIHVVVDGSIFFSGTRDTHLAEQLYRVGLDGKEPQRLTDANFHHNLIISTHVKLVLDSYSRVDQPIQVKLLHADGRAARTVDTNPVADLDRIDLANVEWSSITMRDGFALDATIIKPAAFDPATKYPVWLQTYGGPHAASLQLGWQGGRLRERLLAEMGIVAFRFDPRSASGRGACSAWTAYQQLGVQETRDVEDAIDWLNWQSFVDSGRIGLSGHSYGGFLTAYVMTHSTKFSAGIAGAPVTDWRNYDSIYTERFMGLPQNNPDGYAKTSVVDAAGQLHGRLLLLHGARDDNVHLANSLQFANALQKAGKQFELMVYPNDRHGITGSHYDRLMIDFMRTTMDVQP